MPFDTDISNLNIIMIFLELHRPFYTCILIFTQFGWSGIMLRVLKGARLDVRICFRPLFFFFAGTAPS